MDKRVIAAAAASLAILLCWNWLFPPPERPAPVPEPQEIAGSVEPETERPASPAETAAPVEDRAPPPDSEPIGAEAVEEIVVENDVFAVTLSNRGGRIRSWKLHEYTTRDGAPLELMPQFEDGDSQLFLVDVVNDGRLTGQLDEALHRVERERTSRGTRVRFSWADGRGVEVVKSLTFRDGDYLVDVEIHVTDRGRLLPARLRMGPGFGEAHGFKSTNYYYSGQVAWNLNGSVSRTKEGNVISEPAGNTANRWVGFEDQYFAALVVPGGEATEFSWGPTSAEMQVVLSETFADEDPPAPALQSLLSVAVPVEGAQIYFGPKKYTLLRDLGHDLDKAVWFASNRYLAWIARGIFRGLLWIHDHTIHNYGLAIILATVALRLILFPVNQYSMVSMKKTQLQMQKLQPKIKAIRAKYKKAKDAESRAKMNQDMMEMYRREGVNPMGGLSGCLPLLAQFPILIGFYNMLTVAVELRGAPFFGWIRDLSESDPIWVMPLLMGATMFVQQRMAMSKVKDPVQQQQQKIMMIMPVVFTVICISMPAGMVLYWFVNNLLGMGQQWLVNHQTTRLEAASHKAAQKA